MTGTVKWFDGKKGFGFIEPDERIAGTKKGDVFVHYSNIVGDGYRELKQDQRVEFEVAASGKGPQADNVQVIG